MRKIVIALAIVVFAALAVLGALLLRKEPTVEGPIIAVSVVTHNEDPLNPRFPDFSEDRSATIEQRDLTLTFAQMLRDHGAAYNYQTDWNFLVGLQEYDDTDFLKQLARLGVSVDAHSHEHMGYNYADVAALIASFGVTPSGVVGGYIAAPTSASKLEYFWQPIEANKSNYTWTPTVLWGAGTSMHQNESDLWISGVWRPESAATFDVHSATAPLPNVGGYSSDWDGLDELLALRAAGELNPDALFTVTIMTTQDEFTEEFINEFETKLETYTNETAAGYLRWMAIQDVAALWSEEYNEQPTMLRWTDEHADEESNGAQTQREGCGNGICEAIERQRGLCQEDCP